MRCGLSKFKIYRAGSQKEKIMGRLELQGHRPELLSRDRINLVLSLNL